MSGSRQPTTASPTFGPLRDAGQVGETVGGPRSRRKDNLLIRGDAVSGLRSLIRLISSITQRS
jgi:hypothetical protein